ncbi:MAG: hypothetical protein P1U40_12295 [Coxiellaceae bacterium]|nr:hypothetical protein [Coxiellaceae bacterium]
MATNDFSAFLEALGAFESGIDTTKSYGPNDLDWLMVFDPSKGNVDRSTVDISNPEDLSSLQYHVHNTLGFLGKYQFGEPLLIDLGYYTPGPNGFYGSTATNEWQGTWTGKNGVNSKEDFMSTAQELAIREAFAMNTTVIETRLEQAGKTLDDYIGTSYEYTRNGVQETAVVTLSGILASAHLQGPGGVANLLLNNSASSDEYGTNILFYMDSFGGYDNPFGTASDDTLSGSDYDETFSGGAGVNTITTGDGYDKIEVTANANGVDVVTDFDVNKDAISMSKLGGVQYSDLDIVNNADGNAQVNLANNQKIILEGVDAAELSGLNFVQGLITLGWNYNSGDTVLENYNPQHDLIDLNYAFDLSSLALYEENGSVVIDVLNNNQRYILEGVSLDQLEPYHFIKAPIGFAELFGQDNTPPVNDNPDPTPTPDPTPEPDPGPVVDPTPTPDPVVPGADGVYSFTWNWGADEVVADFDASTDVLDLQSFWTDYGAIGLADNANGDAVIDLSNINNQTITLQGVSVDELSANNIHGVGGTYPDASAPPVDTQPPVDDTPAPDPTPDPTPDPVPDDSGAADVYSYTWGWGSHDNISGFDASQDVVDLSAFWTSYSEFSIANNAGGDAVIDLTAMNNQTITLVGVSADELGADNIRGVQGDIGQALGESTAPPVDDGVDSTPAPTPDPVVDDGQDVYSFTWAWGSDDVVSNFDTNEDVIDLHSFWTSSDEVSVYNNANGDAVIDLSLLNNQTITIEGVSVEELGDNNILY